MRENGMVVKLIGGLVALVALLAPSAASAGNITPSDGVDEYGTNAGHCSLREAITAAQTNGTFDGCVIGTDDDSDTIVLASGTTYELTLAGLDDANAVGDLDVVGQNNDRLLNIDTTGGSEGLRAVIDANDGVAGDIGDRVMELRGTDGFNSLTAVNLSNVELTGGNASPNTAGAIMVNGFTYNVSLTGVYLHDNKAAAGGAMRLDTVFNTMITSSRIESNTADSFAGLYHESGSVTITGSSLADNHATVGNGGAYGNNNNYLDLVIANSTLIGNTAATDGGAIYTQIDRQNPGNDGTSILSSVTIAGNEAGGDGGGISLYPPGESEIRNSIIADNTDAGGEAPDCDGSLDSQGYNLIESTLGCTINTPLGEVTGTDPKLSPTPVFGDNGTQVLALLPGSPALNAGNPGTPGSGAPACANTDQRGKPRATETSAACDIGALEIQGLDPDGDKYWDIVDNCDDDANGDQADFDGDTQGDACDIDDDDDVVPDSIETGCPGGGNPLNVDSDGDGVEDQPDDFPCDGNETTDSDFDGVGDNADNCDDDENPGQENADGDLLGNECDPDDDNDGVLDVADACPTVAGSQANGCAPPPVIPAPPGPGVGTATGLRAAAIKKCKRKKSKNARKKCLKKARKLPL